MWESGDPILEFWDLLISRERLKLETSNLARRRKAVISNEKKCKIGSKRVTWGSRNPILEFWDPPNIARTVVARNFKFGTETKGGELERKKMQNWVKRGHVTQFWNFGKPLISRERLKLEASNLARRRTATSSNEKNAELGQKGSCGGHVTQFWNFGTP